MLSRLPSRLGWDCNACEAAVFHQELCLLSEAMMVAGAKPGINVTGHVYGCCSNKIVPMVWSAATTSQLSVGDGPHHEVRL